MKVMHILQSDRFSGAENVVCQIISMCRDENTDFVYCSRDGEIREALLERNIRGNLMKKLSVKELKRVIREEKPDVLHAHDMRAGVYAALCAGKIPVISHIHNNNFDSRGMSLKSVLYYLAARKMKHIFWVSESAFQGYKFHDKLQNKSSVLYNILDTDLLEQKAMTDPLDYDYDLVYLGRLTYQKNPQRMLTVLQRVLKVRPKTKIAVIGSGDMEEEIKNLAKEKNLQAVDFLGFNSNPYKILKCAKVMIMTSRWEGLPMCALEAQAFGLPIVSTPADGMKDLVFHDRTGYLSDDDDVLADKIVYLLENPQQYARISENVKMLSLQYNDKEKYVAELRRVYQNCRGMK